MVVVATDLPSPKRVKLSPQKNDKIATTVPPGFVRCQQLLITATSTVQPFHSIRSALLGEQTKNDLNKVKKMFDLHGFRTSVVMSPRPALSIYKDSCLLDEVADESCDSGKHFLLMMIGMHPDQSDMELWYSTSIKKVYCLSLFCNLVRKVCPQATTHVNVHTLLFESERICQLLGRCTCNPVNEAKRVSALVPERISALIMALVKVDSRIRTDQLEREYEHLACKNSTMSNAMVQLFEDAQDCNIKDIYFKRSHIEKYERITVYLYDPDVDIVKPPRFTFMPSLHRILVDGPGAVVKDIMQSFWSNLLRRSFFPTPTIKTELTPEIEKYLLSGISSNLHSPVHLNAHFDPTYPLSFYLHGKAGVGKSALARNFAPALNAAITEHVDPEVLVRFVKQNLNKPHKDLQLELELRPNNNDLSVMSIIQGRRMTMTQSKPGLVVVNLEEMPSNASGTNPNQLKTAQLISQRFSGRNGDYKEDEIAPRNSARRGISGDATLILLLTSNYALEAPCANALTRLNMFENLKCIEMTALSGGDRLDFAVAYISQCVRDQFADFAIVCEVELNIPYGDGDTRPLVRQLRMLSFYIVALSASAVTLGYRVKAKITKTNDATVTVSASGRSMKLKCGSLQNLFPVYPKVFDGRVGDAIKCLRKLCSNPSIAFEDISIILDFYFAKTLTPAVIVSTDADLVRNLVEAVGSLDDVHSITDVDPSERKMMKSLYDANDTPNLRDDILKFGKGVFVAIELKCNSTNDQMCIREIIEDNPSMTAFSTNESALHKSGLFFGVYVKGDITPEIRSRASLIV